jgi:hypothetical protein
MDIALVAGQRSRPEPGLIGVCQPCGKAAQPKCGAQVKWHWAQKGGVIVTLGRKPNGIGLGNGVFQNIPLYFLTLVGMSYFG